ncbi:MAG: tetratricopeptide repeat protein [Planctomycetota bacterium]|nr:tetratricopeptide repeat protein [Planctomycetota bacterium]
MKHPLWILAALVLALPVAPQDQVEAPLPAIARTGARVVNLTAAPPGTWADFFVEHQVNPERLEGIEPRLLRLGGLAEQAYAAADFPSALELGLDQLRLMPDFPPALLLVGTTCFRLRRYQDCQRVIERFLEVAPSEVWRTQVLGHALYTLGLPAEGRDHYRAILDVLPESVEARRGLALCLYQLGETEAAATELTTILDLRPDHAEAWVALARVRFDQEQLEAAQAAAARAMELAPFEPIGYFIGFRVLFELGEDEDGEALELRWRELTDASANLASLRNRLLHSPTSPGLLRGLASELAALGDRRSMIPILRRLTALPGSIEQRVERDVFAIRCVARVGDLETARRNLASLAELHGEQPAVKALQAELGPEPKSGQE